MSLTTRLVARIRAVYLGAADHGTPQAALELYQQTDLATGTGASAADKIFSDQRTLSASATETLDLTSLTDVFGVALSFAKIKGILIKAAAGNTNDVVVGNAASNAFVGPLGGTTPTVTIPAGGFHFIAAPVNGWTVDGTHKNLKVANSSSGTSVTYDIMLVGTSA